MQTFSILYMPLDVSFILNVYALRKDLTTLTCQPCKTTKNKTGQVGWKTPRFKLYYIYTLLQ